VKNKSPGPGGLCTFIEDTAGNVPWFTKPIGSMYGIFTNIYHKNQPNVGEYTIHGSYGKKQDAAITVYKIRFQTSADLSRFFCHEKMANLQQLEHKGNT